MKATRRKDSTLNHRLRLQIGLAIWGGLFAATSSAASVFYDFVESNSNEVYATLELASLPATHLEVVELTFTPIGAATFGFPSPYPGVFDGGLGMFVDDGIGGLSGMPAGTASMFDINGPDSAHHPLSGTFAFQLFASGNAGSDEMRLLSNIPVIEPVIVISGNWTLVPAPTSLATLTIFLLGTAAVRRR